MTGRDRTALIVLCVLGVIAASWFLVISPKRSQAAKLGDQLHSAQSQLDAERSQVLAGEAAKSSFASSYTMLARLGEAVPVDDNVPSLIYELQGAANAAHVDFRSLSLNATGSSTTGSSSGAGASSPSAAQASTAALPPGATVGPAGFPIEPFTFTFQGNFFHLADFLGRLERFVIANNGRVAVSGRLMSLNAISLGPAAGGFPQIAASISATTYLVPASQGLENGAGPGGPAGSTASSVSSPSLPRPSAAAVVTPPLR